MLKEILNRKTYNAVRKMDRQEMEKLFKDTYEKGFQQGFREGAKTGQQVDVQIELVQFLNGLEIKGVGQKTKEKILQSYKERKGE